nr:unnamed protein product [Callosobruchus chinensis]
MKDLSLLPINAIVILLSFLAVFTDGQDSCSSGGLYSFQTHLKQHFCGKW